MSLPLCRCRVALFSLLLTLNMGFGWGAGAARAQHPIGPELRASHPSRESKLSPRILFGPGGSSVIAWGGGRIAPCGEGCSGFYQIRWNVYSPAGHLVSEELVEKPNIFSQDAPVLAPGDHEEFSILWPEFGSSPTSSLDLYEKRVNWATGQSRGPTLILSPSTPEYFIPEFASRLSTGELSVVGVGPDEPPDSPTCPECYGVYTLLAGADDLPFGQLSRANADVMGKQLPTGSAADGQGHFLVTWWSEVGGPRLPTDAIVQRFSHQGVPITPEIRANSHTEGSQDPGGVAADEAGDFVVVWQSAPPDGFYDGIFAQRFNASAERVGLEQRVDTSGAPGPYNARVAMDRAGNFVVVWQSFSGGAEFWDIKGQLFRKDGAPVGREFFVNTHRPLEQESPYVAFGENGTFGAVWTSNSQDGSDGHDIYFQRFSASPGDEPCWVRGGQVFCDTGRTGGEPEIETTFGGRPGETLLSGDFDGDGRADLCARFGTRFRCDLDHRGAPAEAKVDFGLASDVPMMGDLDGDGRADVCVRRKRQFLCDSGHDGGKPEIRVVFGLVSDTPLLGDLNGDGKDDPCLWRAGHFLCDTAHDGNGAEIDLAFGQAGDQPVLGDLDGDDRDDPCVLRAGHLLCDTAHDGGAADVDLLLATQSGDRPLLANLDAL